MKKMFALLALAASFLLHGCSEHTPAATAANTPEPSYVQSSQPEDALSALRSDMKPPVMAVADLGFPTLSEEFGIMDYLLKEYPRWMEENDFIRNIPETRIVNTCGEEAWAQLLCIVPKDPAASVSVEVVRHLEAAPYTQTDVVYSSTAGEPILLLADISDSADVFVIVTDSEGRGLSWMPYWETYQVIPEDAHPGALVMYFTPESERTAYSICLEEGWTVPDDFFLTDHYFHSDYAYGLELLYYPGDAYDGDANIYEPDASGNYTMAYSGHWRYTDGKLHLDMVSDFDSSIGFRGDFPILLSPDSQAYLRIFRTEDGVGLPQFYEEMPADEVLDLGSGPLSPYDYAVSQGWEVPEFGQLMNSAYNSQNGYALDLMEDEIPGDNGGAALIYEVGETGAYTQSYSGFWQYTDGRLHLSLLPLHSDALPVEDTFPVLTLDGALWIGRSESGLGLPYFYQDQLADTLTPVAG